jgi:hypothetical protein
MLGDSEDLLQQLSSDLGLPEFMDDGGGGCHGAGNATFQTISLYEQLLADSSNLDGSGDDSSIFSDMMHHDGEADIKSCS